jgi:hypothetical protein
MSEIDRLLERYRDQISIPWSTIRSDAERTLFVVYDRTKERQIRARINEFREKTEDAGKKWKAFDVTDEFPMWFAQHPNRDDYFEYPEDMPGYRQGVIQEFQDDFTARMTDQIRAVATPDHAVAIVGVGALFGVARVSAVMTSIASVVPGRLVIFFPGEKLDSNYRLLGARDGWSYLATAITAE